MTGLRYPGCVIDLEAREVRRNGKSTSLTAREVEMLQFLSARAGEVVSRLSLEREVWGFKAGVRSEAVPVAVRRLRDKIEADSTAPVLLTTMKNQGWRLCSPVDVAKNLRRFHTPWVARQGLMDGVDGALGDFRVITLVGPGGAGKTRLATEVLGASAARSVMVDLCRIEDSTGVVQQLLADTGFDGKELGEVSLVLDARIDVVLVDNAEHVLQGVAELVDELVNLTENLRFLVTSRAPLGLPFERVIDVGPMESADAEALFRAHFSQVDADADVVAKLVTMVDRLPLAIELVARQRVPLEVLVDLVAGGGAGQEVSGAIRWSWDLLDADTKEVLRICALWPGTAPVAGVEAVAGRSVTVQLHRLVDSSMLQRGLESVRMLQLVRAFVNEEPGADPAIRERWRTWVLSACERACDLRLCSADLERAYLARTDVLSLVADDPAATLEEKGRALILLAQIFQIDRLTRVWKPRLLALKDQLPVPYQHHATVLGLVWDYYDHNWDRLENLASVDVSQAPPIVQLRFLHLWAVLRWRKSDNEQALHLIDRALTVPGVQSEPRWYLAVGVKSQILRDLARHEEASAVLRQACTVAKASGWTALVHTLEAIEVDNLGFFGKVHEAAALGQALLARHALADLDFRYENLLVATATAQLEFDPDAALETLRGGVPILVATGVWKPHASALRAMECLILLLAGDAAGCLETYKGLSNTGRNPMYWRLAAAFALAAEAVERGSLAALRAVDPLVLASGVAGAGAERDGPAILIRLEALVNQLRGEPVAVVPALHPGAAQIVRALESALARRGAR